MAKAYDVVIIGGGPAGLATAIALRRQCNCSVLLADAGPAVRERPGESVPPEFLLLLRRLGLEENFRNGGHVHSPGSAVIWGRDMVGYNDHLMNPMGPSWRLNRAAFDTMLTDAATVHGVDILWQTKYLGIEKNTSAQNGFYLHFSQQYERQTIDIQTSFVVDASGPLARFVRDIDIKTLVDDQLFGLAAYSPVLSGDMTQQVLIESTETGWWYAVRLPDGRLLRMFVTEADTLRAIQNNNYSGWHNIAGNTRLIAPAIKKLTLGAVSFHTFPIWSSRLEQTVGDNWLAVGDAATCFDPVASQGLYKCLKTGIAAATAITQKITNNDTQGLSIYREMVLSDYQGYFKNRTLFYGQERRWGDGGFWGRRAVIAD